MCYSKHEFDITILPLDCFIHGINIYLMTSLLLFFLIKYKVDNMWIIFSV